MALWRLNATKRRRLGITRLSHMVNVIILFLLVISLFGGCLISTDTMDSGAKLPEQNIVKSLDRDNQHKVGGLCEYIKYRGKAVIVSIIPKTSSEYSSGPLYEEYEVKFSFLPEDEIKDAHGKVEGEEYVLTLANSWYPGPEFLKKYGIKVGKRFECFMNVITKGACTPIVFDFPDIDRSDYFEIEC